MTPLSGFSTITGGIMRLTRQRKLGAGSAYWGGNVSGSGKQRQHRGVKYKILIEGD